MWNRLNREEQLTSDACRLERPGAVAQWSAAPNGPLGRGSSQPGGALVRLEPCEGKLSRTVLRGAQAGNRSRLPGTGAAMTQALAAAGINLRGVSGAAFGRRFVAYLALDRRADAAKAVSILKKLA
jgi:hypothetical protein